MEHGPGKYDAYADQLFRRLRPEALCLGIFEGTLGTGWSNKTTAYWYFHLPKALRAIASDLRIDGYPTSPHETDLAEIHTKTRAEASILIVLGKGSGVAKIGNPLFFRTWLPNLLLEQADEHERFVSRFRANLPH